MAHFAQLNDNTVAQVVVISNADLLDANGVEQESIGLKVCQNIFGKNTVWVQTSYNGNFRRKYAEIGDIYEPNLDVFYSPVAPFPSWSLDENYEWQPPTPKPAEIEGSEWAWNEETLSWDRLIFEIPEEGV